MHTASPLDISGTVEIVVAVGVFMSVLPYSLWYCRRSDCDTEKYSNILRYYFITFLSASICFAGIGFTLMYPSTENKELFLLSEYILLHVLIFETYIMRYGFMDSDEEKTLNEKNVLMLGMLCSMIYYGVVISIHTVATLMPFLMVFFFN